MKSLGLRISEVTYDISGNEIGHPAAGSVCAIVSCDIACFTDPARDDDIYRVVRQGLYRAVPAAFNAGGVPWADCYHEDRGDGILIVVPPETAPPATVASVSVWLDAEVRRYNKAASPAARIQLRAGLHAGPVHHDDHGLYGAAVIHACRLIDAWPVRDALAAPGADTVFAVSAYVYDTVIRHSPGLVNAAAYRQIDVRVKKSTFTAWMTSPATPPPGASGRLLTSARPIGKLG
jgi:hypothetical protein